MTTIKVFSDFACPFCYIGFSIAEKLSKENPDVHFEYYPYELEPDAPAEGYDFADNFPMDQIETSYKRIKRLGSEYGLIYNNKTKKSNTHRLHKASLYAKKEDKFFESGKEAFKAIFEDSKNLGDPKIINEIGLAAGLNIVEMNRCIDAGNFDEFMDEAKNLMSYEGPDAYQHPAGRVGNPLDIANMVLYLCSDKAGFITGENICIDGGMTRQMIYHDDFGWTLA